MTLRCHACAAVAPPTERVGRRDACAACGADLHCCRNCGFFDVGLYNQCREPQATRQVEKERGNFCEFFAVAATPRTAKSAGGARAALDDLFTRRGGVR